MYLLVQSGNQGAVIILEKPIIPKTKKQDSVQ